MKIKLIIFLTIVIVSNVIFSEKVMIRSGFQTSVMLFGDNGDIIQKKDINPDEGIWKTEAPFGFSRIQWIGSDSNRYEANLNIGKEIVARITIEQSNNLGVILEIQGKRVD